jgi:PAS domain S-box-containing protein
LNLPDQIRQKLPPAQSAGEAPSAQQLLCELQLHQTELEMQNAELQRVRAELERERTRYFNLYELAPVGYCTVSEAGLILQANLSAANLLGVHRSEMISKALSAYMLRQGGDKFYLLCQRLMANGQAQSIDVTMVRRDGTQMLVHLAANILTDASGQKVVLVVLSDITERQQLEALRSKQEAAESANQAKSRFLAAASHDLRQPTHAMGLFVARLVTLPHQPEARQLVNYLAQSVTDLQEMLDTLFDVSQLETEPLQVKLVPFPINRLFGQLHNGFGADAARKGLRLRFRPSPAWVQSDPVLLHRILLNLVSNAIRYTRHGGVLVACRLTGNGSQVRIEVWDTGIGIAQKHQERVFDEYFQVENLERDRTKGLGLGLSIVDRICRLLGHKLTLQSVPGRGSRFSLTLPLAEQQADVQPAHVTSAAMDDPLQGLRLLVVEDDDLGRKALTSVLESWGCTVIATDGAQAACEQLQSGQLPDVIVSDYRLRDGSNGIEAIRMLREKAGRPIAACLISGDADTHLRQRAQNAGLVVLLKPVRPAKLRQLLRHLQQKKAA